MSAERMEAVFRKTRTLGQNPPEHSYHYDLHKLATEKYARLPRWEKIARSTAGAILNQKVYIEPEDAIFGRTYYDKEKPIEVFDPDFDVKARRGEFLSAHPEYAELCEFNITGWGILGHIAWNWNYILKHGTVGLREQCNRGLTRLAGDEESEQFFKGVLIMLDALEGWSDLHAEELIRLGRLEEAEMVRRVPRYPARNFREAVQSYFMQHLVVMKENPFGGNSPGRLDYYLWPFLQHDLSIGAITEEEAQELANELFLRIDERIYKMDTWGESVVLGGSFDNGESAVNPLTYIMLRAFMKYDLTHPYLYMRMPENPPKEYLDACAEYVIKGGNRAQIINDKAIVSAMTKHGVTESDAYAYYCGGCMEIGVQGATSDLLFAAFHSIPQILEFCITGGYSITKKRNISGVEFKNLTDFKDFESFYVYFREKTKTLLHLHLQYMDVFSEQVALSRPSFLISSMIEGCMERGKGMHSGGAKYHDYGASLMGIPNVADSLTAIKRAVFEDKICSAERLIEAMKSDFVGHELLRKRLINLPKYGKDDDEGDGMMIRVSRDICSDYASYKNRFGGYGKPVILSFIWAPVVGEALGATPDGRRSGIPVAQAVTPQSASMTNGITAAINSAAKLPFDCFPGGATTMWDLDPSIATNELVKSLITVFFERGGQFFQGNVVDEKSLIKAQKDPESYPNLIVRVGGYSARFTWLSVDLQNEIINRIKHKR